MKNTGILFISTLLLVLSLHTYADNVLVDNTLVNNALTAVQLQQEWDHANFEISNKDQKTEALKILSDKARLAAHQQDTDAAVQIWSGIILSSYAGDAGGLSALGLVKEAKKYFENSIELDPISMRGAAYTSLGSLYYQVPGWPIGFGDNDKAEIFLKKGLALDPDGIDANYFYADFLFHQKKYHDAITYFEKTLDAAPRDGRYVADNGRKLQAQTALDAINQKIQ